MRPVVWIGRFRGYNGFARATRQYVESLIPYLDKLIIAPLEVLEENDPLQKYLGNIEDHYLKVVNHKPTMDPEAEVYLSVWEFDRMPDHWVDIFNQAKLIMTQSNFCKQLFAKIEDPSKIAVIPYIIPPKCSPTGPILRFTDSNNFVFGSVFEWLPRKAPERMIEAFIEEFDKKEPVDLILRTTHPSIQNMDKWIFTTYHDSRVKVINSPIPDLASFYRGLNAYLSCTAGEGFGQTMAEAMACGIPTIASRHSGNLEFMNDSNSWLVDVEDWSAAQVDEIGSFRWKMPVIRSIRKVMREVVNLWSSGKESMKVKKALQIKEKMSSGHTGQLIFKLLHNLL